jgi:sporulation protein YtfJ
MVLQQGNNKIASIIESTFKNLNEIIDVNTVVGKPIKTDDGEYVVPISKVTIGVLMGGGEYGKVSIFKKGEDLPYSAGNGAIISIKPCGFLLKENEHYKIISVCDKPMEKLFEKATDFISEFGKIDNEEKN